MPSDIRGTTLPRCCDEKNKSRNAHFYAELYYEQGSIGYGHAIEEQRIAAYHAREAMLRLDRLIGVA
jgi:hypothetical protein